MRRFDKIVLGIGASVAGMTPAAAAPQKPLTRPPTAVIVPKTDAAKMPNFLKMMEFVDKLFPPQPDPDPARLALARTSVAAIWPEGSYGRMMTGMMGGMIDRVMQMKPSDLPVAAKEKAKAAAGTSDLSLHDQMAAKDPYFDRRMAAVREVMAEEGGKLSAVVDPRIRDGLARSMARRFDARQLADINTFFATPSGHALANQYMQIWVDPDMIRSMFGAVPEMIQLMPDMMAKVKAASDRFPLPPKAAAKTSKP